jgi:hypothetical protein
MLPAEPAVFRHRTNKRRYIDQFEELGVFRVAVLPYRDGIGTLRDDLPVIGRYHRFATQHTDKLLDGG